MSNIAANLQIVFVYIKARETELVEMAHQKMHEGSDFKTIKNIFLN